MSTIVLYSDMFVLFNRTGSVDDRRAIMRRALQIAVADRGWHDEPRGTGILSRFFWMMALDVQARYGWPEVSIQLKESNDGAGTKQ